MKNELMLYYLVIEDLKIIQEGRCGKVQRKRLLSDIKEFNKIFHVEALEKYSDHDDLSIEEYNMINHQIIQFYETLITNKVFPFSEAFSQKNSLHDVSALKPSLLMDHESFSNILRNSLKVLKLKQILENQNFAPYLSDSLAIAIDVRFYYPELFEFGELWQLIDALMEFHLLTYQDKMIEKETDEGFADFYYRSYSISLNAGNN